MQLAQRATGLLVGGLLLGGLAHDLQAQRRADPLAGLDAYIEKVRTDWGIPGIAVGIIKGDSLIYAKGFGVKEAGKPDPVDPRTLFAIGSNTKSFTATAAAMLVDEGKLSWDDKVIDRYPGFRLYDPYVTREIAIGDILSHRSGLGRRGDALWYGTGYSRDEIVHRIRFLKPNAPFRTVMGYQNIMVMTAGEIVGKVSGLGWDRFIQDRIFAPLGMTASNTSVTALAGLPDVASPHTIEDGKARVIPYRNIDNIGPAGSINSNIVDMAKYVRMHLGDGTFEGKKLVSAANLGVTKTPHINVGGVGDSLTHFTSYGLGWVLLDYRGRKIAWHNGGIDGMLSEMWTVPDEKLGVVVLTNAAPHAAGPPIVREIIDRFLVGKGTKDYEAEALAQAARQRSAQEAQEKKLEAERVPNTTPSLPLERYVGTYADSLYGDLSVSLDQGKLALHYTNFTTPLEHWHFDTFRGVPGQGSLGKLFVTFQLDSRAKVAKLVVDGLDEFERKEP
jgi:CubicO group peptidase (beta-lactamase class C family)